MNTKRWLSSITLGQEELAERRMKKSCARNRIKTLHLFKEYDDGYFKNGNWHPANKRSPLPMKRICTFCMKNEIVVTGQKCEKCIEELGV